jgi:hypothetical protein
VPLVPGQVEEQISANPPCQSGSKEGKEEPSVITYMLKHAELSDRLCSCLLHSPTTLKGSHPSLPLLSPHFFPLPFLPSF